MFLKSLTLKGFKSFADPSTLLLEPGVTVVVGPNGSGKSNVVDAVAWVLGAQGPRTVRSSKMEDVIFAGSADRPQLGRAEVSLTIDNRTGRLPGGLAEITITRTLFRSGESEYAINGQPCRLLDIQEMLSDSGVGRQQHVIVSQGQLGAILDSRPEDRRAVIEEAAGVLKHRRRRERAERRLAATEENLDRLGDLLREVSRQIRPARAPGRLGPLSRVAHRGAACPATAPRGPGDRRARRPPRVGDGRAVPADRERGHPRHLDHRARRRGRGHRGRARHPARRGPRRGADARAGPVRAVPGASRSRGRAPVAPSHAPWRRRPTPTWCRRSKPTRRAWRPSSTPPRHEDEALAPAEGGARRRARPRQ